MAASNSTGSAAHACNGDGGLNFYKRFVGDMQAKTGHLSLSEFGAYDRLLDHYYATERPLPGDVDSCCRIARAMTKDERKAVESVLAQFFSLDNGLFVQRRAEEMIAEAQPKIEANRINGGKGGRPKKVKTETQEKPTGFSDETQIEPNANLSQNQSQITPSLRSGGKRASALPCPPDVAEQVWVDWLTLRKKKSAPVTTTVLEGAIEQARLAGMPLEAFLRVWCRRGSQGLEAAWLKPDERGQQVETTYQRTMRERMQEAAPEAARKDPAHAAHAADFFNAIEVPTRTVERIR